MNITKVDTTLPFTSDLSDAIESKDWFSIYQAGRMQGYKEGLEARTVDHDQTQELTWFERERVLAECEDSK